MTDKQAALYVVLTAFQQGRISLQTALAAGNAIEADNFIPANFPAFGVACNAIATFLQQRDVALQTAIAQIQALATSTMPI